MQVYLIAVLLMAGVAMPAIAGAEQESARTSNRLRVDSFRGLPIRSPEGEDLGAIEDLLHDEQSQQVHFAAVSYGGFLRFNDQLFAIPIEALRLSDDGEKPYFTVDLDKATLRSAPGFSRDAWPDVADPAWLAEMDSHFGRYTVAQGTITSRVNAALQMTDRSGTHHTLDIGPYVPIVAGSVSADLRDLRAGQQVQITMNEREGSRRLTLIQVLDLGRTARQPSERTTTLRRN